MFGQSILRLFISPSKYFLFLVLFDRRMVKNVTICLYFIGVDYKAFFSVSFSH